MRLTRDNNEQHPRLQEEEPHSSLFWKYSHWEAHWKQVLFCFSRYSLKSINQYKHNQGRTGRDAHSSLHGDGDRVLPSGTGSCRHRCHHPPVERGTSAPGNDGAVVTSSTWCQRSRAGGQVGGGPAPAALWRPVGELPAGGALWAEAVLARGGAVPEGPPGSPGAGSDPDLLVPVRHWYHPGLHRGPVLDGSASEGHRGHRRAPGGDGRPAEPDCPRGVHTQPRKAGADHSGPGAPSPQVAPPQPASSRLAVLRVAGLVSAGAGGQRSAVRLQETKMSDLPVLPGGARVPRLPLISRHHQQGRHRRIWSHLLEFQT